MRKAFTIIELLVVITIIAILAGLLLPGVGMVRDLAVSSKCAQGQRQLVMSMLAYAADHEQVWPFWAVDPDPSLFKSSTASLELLALQAGGELPLAVFACPANPTSKPPEPGPLVPTTWLTGHQTGYFYDPAVPGRPDASRAVLGDRASWRYLPATSGENHRNVMNFVGSDGHSGKAKLINPGLATVSAMSPDVPGDDLFSGTGDGGTPTARGGGASQKAWLR